MGQHAQTLLVYGVELNSSLASDFHDAVAALVAAQGVDIDVHGNRAYTVEQTLGWHHFRIRGDGLLGNAHQDTEWFNEEDQHEANFYAVGFEIDFGHGLKAMKAAAPTPAQVAQFAAQIAPILASIGVAEAPDMVSLNQEL